MASRSIATIEDRDVVSTSTAGLIRLRHHAALINMASGLVRGKQTGNRLSPFKGRGMDYEESRRYQPGDDRRNLDWRVMARTGKAHTKLFREERERPVFLCLDVSPSMHFATQGRFKAVIAAECLALIGWASFAHGDRIGGIVFGGPKRLERRPARGKRAVLNWIHDVCREENWGRRDQQDDAQLTEKLKRISRASRPGSLLAIASDWRDFDDATERQLMRLAQHNSLLIFFISDALERELPPPGVYPVTKGTSVVALDSRGKDRRAEYRRAYVEREARVRKLAAKVQASFISVSTADNVRDKIVEALR